MRHEIFLLMCGRPRVRFPLSGALFFFRVLFLLKTFWAKGDDFNYIEDLGLKCS